MESVQINLKLDWRMKALIQEMLKITSSEYFQSYNEEDKKTFIKFTFKNQTPTCHCSTADNWSASAVNPEKP